MYIPVKVTTANVHSFGIQAEHRIESLILVFNRNGKVISKAAFVSEKAVFGPTELSQYEDLLYSYYSYGRRMIKLAFSQPKE